VGRSATGEPRWLPPAVVPSADAASARAARVLRVGSKTFTEQYILARLIADLASEAGFKVERAESLGSTVAFDALANNQIDVYVDYTGTLWATGMKRKDVRPAWEVLAGVSGWLATAHDIRCLGALGFENAYAITMRRDRAAALGASSISDLAPRAPSMKLGGDYEFFQRPEWQRLREVYGLGFAETKSYDSSFMYEAVAKGEVDAITAFSSDGRIAAFDLVTLSDPKHALPPYDAILLLSPRVSDDPLLSRALAPMIGAISVEAMRKANWMVDRDVDKKTPAEAATWLRHEIGEKR